MTVSSPTLCHPPACSSPHTHADAHDHDHKHPRYKFPTKRRSRPACTTESRLVCTTESTRGLVDRLQPADRREREGCLDAPLWRPLSALTWHHTNRQSRSPNSPGEEGTPQGGKKGMKPRAVVTPQAACRYSCHAGEGRRRRHCARWIGGALRRDPPAVAAARASAQCRPSRGNMSRFRAERQPLRAEAAASTTRRSTPHRCPWGHRSCRIPRSRAPSSTACSPVHMAGIRAPRHAARAAHVACGGRRTHCSRQDPPRRT